MRSQQTAFSGLFSAFNLLSSIVFPLNFIFLWADLVLKKIGITHIYHGEAEQRQV